MCGFTGFLHPAGLAEADAHVQVRSMADQLVHRGPDDAGTWVDGAAGIALGHRRLSILDLSPAGHQPMVSASGRYVIAYNGEVYNHLDLRAELDQQPRGSAAPAGTAWRGHSDTETLLASVEAWGVRATLEKSVGMFAFALWDRRDRVLSLARDRMGEKPLYYGWQGGTFLFGSELKALRVHPAFRGEIDRDALTLYLRHNSVPAPWSIYQAVHKLLPGTFLPLDATVSPAELPAPVAFWSLRQVAERGLAEPFSGSEPEAIDELEARLMQSVSRQRIADVPLGAFLSGGIDSSTIVALMQAQAPRPVNTFSIGFHEQGFDEAPHAKAVAAHLGTHHTELYVTPRDAIDVIPRLPTIYDEPFGDSSAIPTFLVSQLARRHVTVSLSGDGGDELFAGYTRYARTRKLWSLKQRAPDLAGRLVGQVLALAGRGAQIERAAAYLSASTLEQFYRVQTSQWLHPEAVVRGGSEPASIPIDGSPWLTGGTPDERLMFVDGLRYLPDDILVKVDRAAMAVSLETRVPMLDPRVIEHAWRLPLAMKVRGHETKWALRQVLFRHVPRMLIERPKAGFGVPVGEWVRGPLREWADDLLSARRLAAEGFFEADRIRKDWERYLAGKTNWSDRLWIVLAFQMWLER